ncbi:hypothetical protein PS838_03456 [Pseudomonas fluorescens]|nr:hypothetical protein PS838_03456 [Pseudomonas fluorescens]
MALNQDTLNIESQPLPYDTEHYDRRFLDCWRRQAVVLLEKCGADVDLLFYNSLASTDRIFEDHILNHKPKYSFLTPLIDNEGLSLTGWQQSLKTYETFESAGDDLSEHLEKVPFAIIMGSVFYLPHCPEYQMEHLNHSVVLSGQRAHSVWEVIDDDPSSILRTYRYDKSYIERYFNNNGARLIRYFNPVEIDTTESGRDVAIQKCANYLSSMEDSYKLLTEIEWIANNPYESVSIRAKKIHEAFSIYSGSRSLFSRFAERVLGDQVAASQLKDIAAEAMVIKYAMAKAEVTHRINVGSIVSRCEKLAVHERRTLSLLRKNLGCS